MTGFREKIKQNQRQRVGEAPTASHQLTRMNEKIVSSPAGSHAQGEGRDAVHHAAGNLEEVLS